MIILEGFIDLHTHTRYPDFDSFDYKQIFSSSSYSFDSNSICQTGGTKVEIKAIFITQLTVLNQHIGDRSLLYVHFS